jgi:transposase
MDVKERAGNARRIFDRFHVELHVQDALDKLGLTKCAEPQPATIAPRSRTCVYRLRRPPEILVAERLTFEELRATNSSLFTAYLLKERLADTLDRRQVNIVSSRER